MTTAEPASGNSRQDSSPGPKPPNEPSGGPDRPAPGVVWDYAFPLLTNSFVMLDMGRVIGITIFVVGLVFLGIGAWPGGPSVGDMLRMMPLLAISVGAVAVIMVLVMLVVYRNRFPARFAVNSEGAVIEVTPAQKQTNTASVVLGLLAGQPGVAGSGFLAKAQERQVFAWVDVCRVGLFPRRRAVVLMNDWRTVARLYCTADNYPMVARLAIEGVERTKRERESNAASAKSFRRQLGRDICSVWMMLAIASSILAAASPLLPPGGWLLGIGAATVLGLVTKGQVRSFCGVVGLGLIGVLVFLTVREGAKVQSAGGGYVTFSNFQSVTNGADLKFFVLSVCGVLGLAAGSVRNIVSGRRGA